MSIPLGGFSFAVTAATAQAEQAFARLVQAAQQSAQQIQQSFAGVNIAPNTGGGQNAVNNLRNITSAANQANQALRALTDSGVRSVELRADATQLTATTTRAMESLRQFGATRFTTTLNINQATLAADLQQAQRVIRGLGEGERINLRLAVAQGEVQRISQQLSQVASQSAGTVSVRIDTAAYEAAAQRKATAAEAAIAKEEAAYARAERIGVAAEERIGKAGVDAADRVRVAWEKAHPVQAPGLHAPSQQAVGIGVSVDALKTTEDALRRLEDRARAIGQLSINMRVRADGTAEANAAIERTIGALNRARAGERLNISVEYDDVSQASAALKRLEEAEASARRRGVIGNISVTQAGGAGAGGGGSDIASALGGGALRGLVRGTGLGEGALLGAGFGAAAAAAAGVSVAVAGIASGMIQAAQASIAYNAQLEQTVLTFEHLTGSAEAARGVMTQLRHLADISPFSEAQVQTTGQSFLRLTGGDVAEMQRLTELTVALAAARPELGFEAVQQSIQQLVSGDFRAFEDRMNISVGSIKKLADTGVSGFDLVRRGVELAGGSLELLDKQQNTFNARISTMQSNLQQLNAALGRGFFEGLSENIGQVNDALGRNLQAWLAVAEAIGRVGGKLSEGPIGTMVALASGGILGAIAKQGPTVASLIGAGGDALSASGFGKGEQELPAEFKERQAAFEVLRRERQEGIRALSEEKAKVEEIQVALRGVGAQAARVTAEYERQLVPLRAQLARMDTPTVGLDQRISRGQINVIRAQERLTASEGPLEQRAQAEGALAQAEAERDVIAIRQQRAQLAEQIGQKEQAIARETAQIALRAQERIIRGMQEQAEAASEARRQAIEALRDEQQAAAEVRRDRIEGLQDEIRMRGEARAAALEALRDEQQAAAEARREQLEGIQEQIRTRREGVEIAREAAQEETRAFEESYQDQERSSDRVHRSVMEKYERQIEALREQSRERKGISDAERELAAFDRAERERDRQERLADARLNVRQATNLRGQLEARRNLSRTEADIGADRNRESLQDRVAQQRAAEEKRREDVQERISALERKAREEDRQYQREKEGREDQFRQQQRAQQAADRAAEKAERAQARAEDAQVRAIEKQNRDIERAEQKELQDAERRARAEDRADAAALRAEERAAAAADRAERKQLQEAEQRAREADRADATGIRGAQRGLQQRRDDLSDIYSAEDLERERVHLAQMKEIAVAEDKILAARLRLAELVDPIAKGNATRDVTLAEGYLKLDEDFKAIIKLLDAIQKAPLQQRIAEIERDFKAAMAPVEQRQRELAADLTRSQARIDELEKANKDLDARIQVLSKPEQGPRLAEIGGSIDADGNLVLDPNFVPKPGRGNAPNPLDPSGGAFGRAAAAAPGALADIATWLAEQTVGVATSFLKGLTDVITGDVSWEDAVKGLAYKMLGAGKAVLGIESPSTETAAWAYWLAEGFIQQLEFQGTRIQASIAAAFAVDTALTGLSDQLTTALTAALNSAWAGAAPTADAIPVEIATHIGTFSEDSLALLQGALTQALIDALNVGWAGAVPTADAIPIEIAAHLSEGLTAAMAPVGVEFGVQLTAAINAGWATAVDTVDSIPAEIGSHLNTHADAAIAAFGPQFGTALTAALNAGWAQSVPTVDSIATEIANHIINGFVLQQQNLTVGIANVLIGVASSVAQNSNVSNSFKNAATFAASAWREGFQNWLNANPVQPPAPAAPGAASDGGSRTAPVGSGPGDALIAGSTAPRGVETHRNGETQTRDLGGGMYQDLVWVDDHWVAFNPPYRRAGGGAVRPNDLVLVGEEGPELVAFDTGGYVFNHADSTRMMDAWGDDDEIEGFKRGGRKKKGRKRRDRDDDRESIDAREIETWARSRQYAEAMREVQNQLAQMEQQMGRRLSDHNTGMSVIREVGRDRDWLEAVERAKYTGAQAGQIRTRAAGGVVLPRAGSVLPSEYAGMGQTGAVALSSSSSVTVNGLQVHVRIDGGTGDARALAAQIGPLIVEEFVGALEESQLNAPRAVSRLLPGAVGR